MISPSHRCKPLARRTSSSKQQLRSSRQAHRVCSKDMKDASAAGANKLSGIHIALSFSQRGRSGDLGSRTSWCRRFSSKNWRAILICYVREYCRTVASSTDSQMAFKWNRSAFPELITTHTGVLHLGTEHIESRKERIRVVPAVRLS